MLPLFSELPRLLLLTDLYRCGGVGKMGKPSLMTEASREGLEETLVGLGDRQLTRFFDEPWQHLEIYNKSKPVSVI
jgi:hypothetical protein